MVAQEFIDYLTRFQVTSFVGVEDLTDKLNFLFTVIVLLVCILMVTVKQYVFKPICCYLPTDIGGQNLQSYVENYCWVQGTISLSNNAAVPSTIAEWQALEDTKIVYYQWVPFVLGLQCILFYLPRLSWQVICYRRTGTDIHHLINSANQAVHSSDGTRTVMVQYISRTIEQILYQNREYRSGTWVRIRRCIHKYTRLFSCSKRIGTTLISAYLMVKLLYVANGILQLYIMKAFLGSKKSNIIRFGIDMASNIWIGADWRTTLIFPRVAFCFLNVKHFGSKNSVIAQCVLPLNMLNERIYCFLWCWILGVLIITICSIPIWLVRMLSMRCRRDFVGRFLFICEEISKDKKEKVLICKFESQFLRYDGIFLLKMISLNAGDVITAEIICQLWRIYKTKYVNKNCLDDGSEEDDEDIKNPGLIKLGNQNNSLADKSSPSAPKSY